MINKHFSFIKIDSFKNFKNSLLLTPFLLAVYAYISLLIAMMIIFYLPYKISGPETFANQTLFMAIFKEINKGVLNFSLVIFVLAINYALIIPINYLKPQQLHKKINKLLNTNRIILIIVIIIALFSSMTNAKYFNVGIGQLFIFSYCFLLYNTFKNLHTRLKSINYEIT